MKNNTSNDYIRENQDNNQKTTPVTESPSGLNNSSFNSPGGILQIWLEMRDDYRTLIDLESTNTVEKADDDNMG